MALARGRAGTAESAAPPPPNVGIDLSSPSGTGGWSERKWRSADILQDGSPSLSGVPPQSSAERNWLSMTLKTSLPPVSPPSPVLLPSSLGRKWRQWSWDSADMAVCYFYAGSVTFSDVGPCVI